MTTLYITRGLPGSGKTTRAEAWVQEDSAHRARVNRDELRAMASGGYVAEAERAIVAARDAAITALLKRGIDVVSDDTNLPSRTVRDLRRVATLAGADFNVWDLTDVSLATCIVRDTQRGLDGGRLVGTNVIEDMHQRYIKGRPYPLPVGDEPADATVLEPYVPPADGLPAILVDIDGTMALHGTRSPYDETRVHEDRPNLPVIRTVIALAEKGYPPVFCSGRTEGCREATEEWLSYHYPYAYLGLHMRKVGDTRKDSVVKAEIFDREIRHRYQVLCVFDDRNQVVAMWRSLGLTVMQVAEGNF